MQADEGREQCRLARAVAPHDRDDLAAVCLDRDTAQRCHLAVAYDDVTRRQSEVATDHAHATAIGGSCSERLEPGQQRTCSAARVAHREGKWRPAGEAAELDDRRCDGCGRHDLGRTSHDERLTSAGYDDDAVGVLHDALESVLGKQNGDAEVVHEALQCGEHFLSCGRVEGGGRLVEDEHPRVRGEHRADRHALTLTSRQRAQCAVTQVGQPEQVEGLLHATTHDVGREADRLHPVGELVLDDVGDKT